MWCGSRDIPEPSSYHLTSNRKLALFSCKEQRTVTTMGNLRKNKTLKPIVYLWNCTMLRAEDDKASICLRIWSETSKSISHVTWRFLKQTKAHIHWLQPQEEHMSHLHLCLCSYEHEPSKKNSNKWHINNSIENVVLWIWVLSTNYQLGHGWYIYNNKSECNSRIWKVSSPALTRVWFAGRNREDGLPHSQCWGVTTAQIKQEKGHPENHILSVVGHYNHIRGRDEKSRFSLPLVKVRYQELWGQSHDLWWRFASQWTMWTMGLMRCLVTW